MAKRTSRRVSPRRIGAGLEDDNEEPDEGILDGSTALWVHIVT